MHTKQVGYPQNFQDLECNSDPHGKVITSKIIRKYMKLYKQDPKAFPSPFEYDRLDNIAEKLGEKELEKEKEKVKLGAETNNQPPPLKKKSKRKVKRKIKGEVMKKNSTLNKDNVIDNTELINTINLALNKHKADRVEAAMALLSFCEKRLNSYELINKSPDGIQNDNLIEINYSESAYLPIIDGKFINASGVSSSINLVLDTGASMSVVSEETLGTMGFDPRDITPAPQYKIKTANGISQASGLADLKIYLLSEAGSLYYITFQVLVISDKYLDKLLLSFKDLINLECVWDLRSVEPKVTLNCMTVATNSPIRRSFGISAPSKLKEPLHQINVCNEQIYFISDSNQSSGSADESDLEEWLDSELAIKDRSADFKHVYMNEYVQSCQAHDDLELKCDNINAGGNHPQLELDSSTELDCNENILPRDNLESLYFSESKLDDYGQWWCEDDTINKVPVDTLYSYSETQSQDNKCTPFQVLEQDVVNQLSHDDRPIDQFNNSNDSAVDRPNTDFAGNNSEKSKSAEISSEEKLRSKFPDVSHLKPEDARKFTELFHNYEGAFSNNSLDIGSVNFPPIELNSGCQPVFDKPRPFSEDQYLLVENAVQELMEAGCVEECSNQSLWNANLMLVSSGADDGTKRTSNTLAETRTLAERLEILKKGWRCVTDFRKHNIRLKNRYGGMILPSFQTMLSKHYRKFRSQIDLRKAFFNVRISEKSKDIFTFRIRNRCFRYSVLPMGFCESPAIFCDILTLILSESSFLDFQAKHPEIQHLVYNDVILAFVDDITLLTEQSVQQHLLVWDYILSRLTMFNLKLNGSKCKVLAPDGDLLGYSINTQNGTYHLSPSRTQHFANAKPPTNRQQLVSQLSQWNYYRDLVPSLKHIAQHLLILARSKGKIMFTKVHYKEFYMVTFLLEAQIKLAIPCMTKPLYMVVDSSHTAYSCALFQYLPYGENKDGKAMDEFDHSQDESSFVRSYENADRQLDDQTRKKISKWSNGTLKLCGLTSKSFLSSELIVGITRKELYSLVEALKSFEALLINHRAPIVCFSDCQGVILLSKLKYSSSKFFSISQYLQSLKNVVFCHSPARYFSSLVDQISKSNIGEDIQHGFGFKLEDLELLPNVKIKPNSIIDAEDLYKLLTAPMPKRYSDLAERRKVKFPELISPAQLLTAIHQRPTELSLLKLLYWGPEAIDERDVIFKRKDGKKLTKLQLQKIEQSHQYPALRRILGGENEQGINFLPPDSSVNTEAGLVSQVTPCNHIYSAAHLTDSAFSDVANQEILAFCKSIKLYLEDKKLRGEWVKLYQTASELLTSASVQNKSVDFLLQYFFESCLVNQDSKFVFDKAEFIRIRFQQSNQVSVGRSGDSALFLYLRESMTVPSKEAVSIDLLLNFESLYDIDLVSNLPPSLIFYANSYGQGARIEFVSCLVMNDTSQDIELKQNEPLCRVESSKDNTNRVPIIFSVNSFSDSLYDEPTYARFELANLVNLMYSQISMYSGVTEESVTCEGIDNINKSAFKSKYACDFNKQASEELDYIEPQDLTMVHYCAPCDESLSGEEVTSHHLKCKNIFNASVIDNNENHIQKQLINRQLLISHLLTNGKTITNKFLHSLQMSCNKLREIYELTRKGKMDDKYILLDNILHKIVGSYSNGKPRLLLALDSVTYSFLAQQCHHAGFHTKPDILRSILSRNFHAFREKQLCQSAYESCSICSFNLENRRLRFLNRWSPEMAENLFTPGYCLSVDFVENMNYTKNAHKYLFLASCTATSAVFALAVPDTSSESCIRGLLGACAQFSIPRALRCDYGSGFASAAFTQCCRNLGIDLIKSSPVRPMSNGFSETCLRSYRHLLTRLTQSAPPWARRNYDRLVSLCTIMFNSSIPYRKAGINLSRYQLYLSPYRQFNGLLCHVPNDDDDVIQENQLKKLKEHKKQRIKTYNHHDNPYLEHQLVRVISDKIDQPNIDGGTALNPQSSNVHRVIKPNPANCRLLNLSTGDERSVEWSKLGPVTSGEVVGNLSLPGITDNLSIFEKNIFKKGNQTPILNLIDPSSLQQPTTSLILKRHEDSPVSNNKSHDLHDPPDLLNYPDDESQNEGHDQEDPPAGGPAPAQLGPSNVGHGYNTRNKDKNTFYNVYFSKTTYIPDDEAIAYNSARKRRVVLSPLVQISTYVLDSPAKDSVSFVSLSKTIKSDTYFANKLPTQKHEINLCMSGKEADLKSRYWLLESNRFEEDNKMQI